MVLGNKNDNMVVCFSKSFFENAYLNILLYLSA